MTFKETGMRKLGLLAGICGAAAFALASAAGALPLGKVGQGLETDLLQPVHGCHADWRDDRFGRHRHGRDCRRVDFGERFEPGPPVYVPPPRECYYVGPVRVCP
jgi:hypothetical protein